MPAQQAGRAFQLEMPGRASRHARAVAETPCIDLVLVDEELGRPQPFEFPGNGFAVRYFRHPEAAACQVEPRETEGIAVGEHCGDQGVSAFG